MSDSNISDSGANFREVFSLQVDVKAFADGLAELSVQYQQFLKSLGDQASNVVGVSVFQGVAQELEKLGNEVRQFNVENQQIADDAALAVQTALSKIDQMEEEQATKRAARVKKSAEDTITAQPHAEPRSDSPGAGTENLSALEASLVAVTAAQQRFNTSQEQAAALATNLEASGISQQVSGYSELSAAYAKVAAAQEKLLQLEQEGLAGDTALARANLQLAASFNAAAKAQEQLIAGSKGRATLELELEAATLRGAAALEAQATAEQRVTEAATRLAAAQERASALSNSPTGTVSNAESKALQDQALAAEKLFQAEQKLKALQSSANAGTVEAEQFTKANNEAALATEKLTVAIERVNRIRALKAPEDLKPKEAVEAEKLAVEQLTTARLRLNEVRAQQTSVGGGISPDLSAAYRQEAEAAERVNIAHQQAAQAIGGQKQELGGVLGELGESALRLAKIYILWNAINDVIRGVSEFITAPIKAFEEGFNFLKETELNADKLTGVLAANVKFSEDMAKNFQLASESAGHVVLALRDVSVELKLPYDQLAKVFSALVDSGAAQTVSSMRDLVTLTTDFALAFRAAGREGNAIRSLVSQLPLLFEGDVKSTSAIAEALHMSGEELSTIVANAKTHKDLTEQLEPRLQGLIQGAAQLATSYQDISAALQEQIKRLEGIAAVSVFEQMKTTLLGLDS